MSAIWSSKIHIMPHPQLASSASPEHQPSHKFLKVIFIKNTVCGVFLVSVFLKAPSFFQHNTYPSKRMQIPQCLVQIPGSLGLLAASPTQDRSDPSLSRGYNDAFQIFLDTEALGIFSKSYWCGAFGKVKV